MNPTDNQERSGRFIPVELIRSTARERCTYVKRSRGPQCFTNVGTDTPSHNIAKRYDNQRLLVVVACLWLLLNPAARAGGFEDRSDGSELFRTQPDSDFYWRPEHCCGAVAACIVCGQLTASVDLATISHELPVCEAGTSMFDMTKFFRAHQLVATGIQIDASNLLGDCRVLRARRFIAFVGNSHWLAMNARDDGIYVYDYPEWKKLDITAFAKAFSGKAIVVQRPASDKVKVPLIAIIGADLTLVGLCLWRFGRVR